MDLSEKFGWRALGVIGGFCLGGPVGAYLGYKAAAVGTAVAAGQGGLALLQAVPFVGGIADAASFVADGASLVSDGVSAASDFNDVATTAGEVHTAAISHGGDLADTSELGLKYPPSSYEELADKSELANNIQGNPEDLNGHGVRPQDIQGNDWGRNVHGGQPGNGWGTPNPV